MIELLSLEIDFGWEPYCVLGPAPSGTGGRVDE
jgi:hypothetical protein